ncbi:unnamed protein product [Caenorhabditis bovis]|uniref:Autophagy-related protein 16 domain-containing protein n=1 Tax=Caenorhabditis bovis TaxID=2654633 RepID=A0A8S1F004_9PELO|nr:unnamed protein product [Caenorhabditis bovis]
MSTEQNQQCSYRDDILRQFSDREQRLRPVQQMFRNYNALAEKLARSRHSRASASIPNRSTDDLKALKEELATVYKRKSKNDQDLIDANRRLIETESKLAQAISQRDKLRETVSTLSTKIAKMEKEVEDIKECNNDLNKLRLSSLAEINSLTEKRKELEDERLMLLSKIRELQEQHAEFMNAELELQEKRAQLRIREQIANAIKDTTYDERVSSAFGNSPDSSGDDLIADAVPTGLRFRLNTHEGDVNDVEWLSEDMFASCGSENKIRIWRTSENHKEATKVSSLAGCIRSILRLDFEPDRRVILGSSTDKTCRIWNVDTQRLVATFSGHSDKVTSARFYQLINVVSGSNDRTIKLWDVSNLRCVRTAMVGSSVFDLVTKCGTQQANFASAHFDKKVRFWDARMTDAVRTIELGHRVTSLDVSLDGQQILTACRDDTLQLIDLRTFATLHMYSAEQYRTTSDMTRAVFSPTGEFVASGAANGYIFVWNTKTTKLEKVLRPTCKENNSILSLSWNPSGRGLLAGDKQKSCMLFR